MGKLRARTEEEIHQRYQDILNSAKQLFLIMEYEDISLAIVAKELNITRPSLYNYFDSKEALFLELCKEEYLKLSEELLKEFQQPRELPDFCDKLFDVLMSNNLFVKLMSLHQTVMETKAGQDAMENFKTDTLPFFQALEKVVSIQFPDASKAQQVLFVMQINILMNTVYAYISTPKEQQEVMKRIGTFGASDIPSAKEFYTETLMSLAKALL